MTAIVAERSVTIGEHSEAFTTHFETTDTSLYWAISYRVFDFISALPIVFQEAMLHLKHTVANAQAAAILQVHQGDALADPAWTGAYAGPIRLPPVAGDMKAFPLCGLLPNLGVLAGDPLPGRRMVSLLVRNLTAGTLTVVNSGLEGFSHHDVVVPRRGLS